MVKFIRVSYRNFLSSGNIPVEIQLNISHLTLITGKNGSGKSTIVEAIVFGLFGKPYRSINKNQLINSINQKQCLVELEFEVGKRKYKIVRGIKPNIFEIYDNDIQINQNPNIRDHQKVLETQILKMSYKTFTQVVIMGSGNYIPFMELQPYQRRDFIEDLLDIRVFSTMNTIVKDRIRVLKDDVKTIDLEMRSLKDKAQMQRCFIEKQIKEKTENEQVIFDGIKIRIEENKTVLGEIEQLQNSVNDILGSIDNEIYENQSTLRGDRRDIENSIVELERIKEAYLHQDTCQTCKQNISIDAKTNLVRNVELEISRNSDMLEFVIQKLKNMDTRILEVEKLNLMVNDIRDKISALNERVTINSAIILKDQTTLNSFGDTKSIDEENEKLKEYAKSIVKTDKHKKKQVEALHLNTIVTNLLQDSGIKAKIIKQYVPIINKLVNKYLAKLDFFVSFNLDENFNESVKSRHRDDFTWGSFSEGQKMRINLALIFTWREIARMKNSINTNIVFFDELLDSSLDGSGMDLGLGLLDEMKDSNVFVISHREGSFDKFPSVIQMTTKNNFTMIQD